MGSMAELDGGFGVYLHKARDGTEGQITDYYVGAKWISELASPLAQDEYLYPSPRQC